MNTEQDFTITDNNRQLEAVASFNADEPLSLSATNASGRIEVSTDPDRQSGTLLVAVRRTDNNEFDDDDHALTVKTDGNSISVHPDWQFAAGFSGLARRFRDQLQHGFRPEDWNLSRLKLSPELDFHIFITLPANLADGSQVKLRTASGEVDARNIASRVSIVTASGDVEATDLIGVTAINTASGDVQAINITDSLEINTASGDASIRGGDAWLAARSASGDVSVQDTRLRNSRITTVSGDVSIRAIFDNTGNYGMESVSGDVSLDTTLPGQNALATLGFGTLSGSSHVGAVWEKRRRREWSAGSGDTSASIHVKTVSGDLSAQARLDTSVEARTLSMPRMAKDQEDTDTDNEFQRDMQEFKQEMKEFGKEMKHVGHVPPPTPPTPPTAPNPPQPGTRRARDERQRLKDEERRIRDEERQRIRDARQYGRDERQRFRAEKQGARDHERHSNDDSPIFTAGPSGRPYRDERSPSAPRQQSTEPVTPPPPFEEEEMPTDQTAAVEEPRHTEPVAPPSETDGQRISAPEPADNDRLTVLELLERGDIDIDEAMARLESERETPSS